MANKNVVSFTPIEVGDLNDIPPDLPAGAWLAELSVKPSATKPEKGGFPMLILNWKTHESVDGENEQFVGQRASDMITFFPKGHKGEKMSKIRLKALCDALEIEMPTFTSLKSWDDLAPFIEELEGLKATIYTSVQTGNDGVSRTQIRYTPPGAAFAAVSSTDDEDEAPKATTTAKKKSKK